MPDAVPTVQVQPAAKPWWHSRTLWLNALALGLAAAEDRLGLLKGVLPVSVFELIAFGLPVVNVVLRALTRTAIALQALPQPPQSPPEEKAP